MSVESQVTVVFVDDEPNVLQGLRRVLRSMQGSWRMFFVESGPEALDILKHTPCDVLVCDLCMPGMDGATVLNEARRLYPDTARIILSGQSDRKAVMNTLDIAHVYLAKPADGEIVKSTINQVMAIRCFLTNKPVREIISCLQFLPFQSKPLENLQNEVAASEPDIRKITNIISRDVGMSLKVLQIINSPFFGLLHKQLDILQAVKLLGLERIDAIIRNYQRSFKVEETDLLLGLLSKINRLSVLTALIARTLAMECGQKKDLQAAAYTVGLLHGAGVLALVVKSPNDYTRSLETALQGKASLPDIERVFFNASHAEVGAYLLGLWGLPNEIVEAIAFHHIPKEGALKDPLLLTALHVSEFLAHQSGILHPVGQATDLDTAFLTSMGLADRLPEWQRLTRLTLEKEKLGSLAENTDE